MSARRAAGLAAMTLLLLGSAAKADPLPPLGPMPTSDALVMQFSAYQRGMWLDTVLVLRQTPGATAYEGLIVSCKANQPCQVHRGAVPVTITQDAGSFRVRTQHPQLGALTIRGVAEESELAQYACDRTFSDDSVMSIEGTGEVSRVHWSGVVNGKPIRSEPACQFRQSSGLVASTHHA